MNFHEHRQFKKKIVSFDFFQQTLDDGNGCLAKGGSGGDAPPLNDDCVDRVATIDLLRSGVRLLAALMVVTFFYS